MTVNNGPIEDVVTEGLSQSLQRFQSLAEQRQQIDVEMAKLRQYMSAAIDLLAGSTKEAWEILVNSAIEESDVSASTLTEAIKRILQVNFPDWLTAAKVRDQLVAGGFDFSSYKSNELASVSTTLRRLKDEMEVRQTDGATEYRLEPPNFSMHVRSTTQFREALKRIGPDAQIDRNKVPPNIAGAIWGGTSTDSPENQPTPYLPSSVRKHKTLGQRIAENREKT